MYEVCRTNVDRFIIIAQETNSRTTELALRYDASKRTEQEQQAAESSPLLHRAHNDPETRFFDALRIAWDSTM